jgi:hypothetical protein
VNMLCFRLLPYEDKATALSEAVVAVRDGHSLNAVVHAVDPASFRQVPGSPFVYWVSANVQCLFSELHPLESDGRENRVGLQTSDNFRFLRCWWEVPVPATRNQWVPYAKGGGYSPYYRDIYLCVNWTDNGAEIKDFARQLGNSPSRSVRSEDHYFRPALTYSDGRTFQFGEGWHSNENAVRFWTPSPRVPKEADTRCYAYTTAYAMMIHLCNVFCARSKTPPPSPH